MVDGHFRYARNELTKDSEEQKRVESVLKDKLEKEQAIHEILFKGS
jgi:hypothetical protein